MGVCIYMDDAGRDALRRSNTGLGDRSGNKQGGRSGLHLLLQFYWFSKALHCRPSIAGVAVANELSPDNTALLDGGRDLCI